MFAQQFHLKNSKGFEYGNYLFEYLYVILPLENSYEFFTKKVSLATKSRL